jgi:hypothetical protein
MRISSTRTSGARGFPTRRSDARRTAAAALLIAGALTSLACFSSQYKTKPRVAVVEGDPVVQMTPPGKLPSLDRPALVLLDRHTNPPDWDENVIGLEVGSQQRAYPVGLLETYEVVNDQSAGLSYVVVRCALTQITAVYDRQVAGRTLTFVNSGALWRDTLVLQDRETGTLWTAATGLALTGPLAGSRLRPIPARVTTTEAWQAVFPASLYLDTGEIASSPLTIRLYGLSSWQGFSGVKTSDARFKPKEEVFAVSHGGETIGFSAGQLSRLGRAEVTLGGTQVELAWDFRLGAPRAFAGEELPVIPMYWFALDRHFDTVRTLPEAMAH